MIERILLLGGTGRTGKEVLKLALERGIGVTALVRDPSAVETNHDLLTVVKGTPLSPEDVATAIKGVDGVVSTLNNTRKSDMPWAKITAPPRLMTDSITNVVKAMKAEGISKIAVLSAGGVGDSYDDTPGFMKFLIKRTNMRQAYEDHNGVDEILRASGLDWTQARAMGLVGKAAKGPIVHSYGNVPKPSMTIPRRGVAEFLLDSVADPEMAGKAPVISQR